MATRFYFAGTGGPVADVSPAFDPNWEQTAQGLRLKLLNKRTLSAIAVLANTGSATVPITTTQDILRAQFVSDPLVAQLLDASVLFSFVVRCSESAATANVFLAYSLRVCSQSGGTIRGTIQSLAQIGTEMAVSGSDATRIQGQASPAGLPFTIQAGDRLVLEIGGHAAAPTAATTYLHRYGQSAASDFALTTGLTTDLNPWFECSADLFGTPIRNYQGVDCREGNTGIISVSEKIR